MGRAIHTGVALPLIAVLSLVRCTGQQPGATSRTQVRATSSPDIARSSRPPSEPSFRPPVVAAIATRYGPQRLAIGRGVVWVEGHRSNNLLRIDPQTNEATTFDVPTHCDVAVGAGSVWTTIASQNLVTRVDPSGRVLDQWKVADPCGIAASDKVVWVTSPATGRLSRIDPDSGRLSRGGKTAPGTFGGILAFGSLWLTSEAEGGSLFVVDPAGGQMISRTRLRGIDAVAAGAGSIWAVGRGSDRTFRVDPRSGAVIEEVALPGPAGGVTTGFGAVWVVAFDDHALYRIDLEDERVTRTRLRFEGTGIDIGAETESQQTYLGPIAAGMGSLWISAIDDNVVLRIDPEQIKDR